MAPDDLRPGDESWFCDHPHPPSVKDQAGDRYRDILLRAKEELRLLLGHFIQAGV